MKRLERPSIFQIMTYPAGKSVETIMRELNLDTRIIRMVSNENPLGTSQKALDAMRATLESSNYYPDDLCYDLKMKLSNHLDMPVDCISVGNGSTELIRLIGLSFLNQDDTVVMSKPSFIMARLATQLMASRLVEIPLKNFHHDLARIGSSVTKATKIIYLDNPNNPVGTMISAPELDSFLQDLPDDLIVVLDEAYREYIDRKDFPDSFKYVFRERNVLVLRSFSKIYGLAGLRVGYCIGRKDLIEAVERAHAPFGVNRLAQKAAIAALDDVDFVRRTKENNDRGLAYLEKELERLGLHHVPSVANFLTVDFGQGVNRVVEYLQHSGVIVRPLAAYDLPTCARVTVGTPDQNHRFIELVQAYLASNPEGNP